MSKKTNRKLQHRRLFVEGLEQRAMLAGNVLASVSGGTLFLRGDNLDNGIVITQTGSANYLVTGIPNSGATTVNGVAGFPANNVRNFDIDLSGGNDVLGIGNNVAFLAALATEAGGGATPAPGALVDAVSIRGYANIRTGAGNDAVGIQLTTPGSVLIQTGAGSDAVAVEAGNEGVLTVQTDTGNQATDGADFARVRGVTLTGAVKVTTLAGDDAVVLSNVKASFIGVYSGVGATNAGVTDHDEVYGENLTSKSTIDVVTLVGNDLAELYNVVSNNVLIDVGAGNDDAEIDGVTLKTATILGQGGNDHIDVFGTANIISSFLTINSGDGNDEVHIDSLSDVLADRIALGGASLITGAGNDGLFIKGVNVRNNLFIDMGTGDDNVANPPVLGGYDMGLTLEGVTVDKVLTALLGTGNDTAKGTSVIAGKGSTVNGVTGTDSLEDGGGNSANIKPLNIDIFLP